MNVNFAQINMAEEPMLILKNTAEKPIGVICPAFDVSAELKYNETSSLSFRVPSHANGIPTHIYDEIIGMRIVELKDVGQFIVMNPKEDGDGIRLEKNCTAYSLEYEFTFKKISLENGTYNLYDPSSISEDIISIILERMPSWSVGSVDASLYNKYRTFEISDENLYNFIKGTLQDSYGCIFEFDTLNRIVNVRDVMGNTNTQPVFISFNNLAKNISVEENSEDIITCLDVNGAEGINIRDVNPLGTNKIINLDYFMTPVNFSSEVIEKYNLWKQAYEESQSSYYNLTLDHSVKTMKKATEEAELSELKYQLVSLENILAVTIQAVAQEMIGYSQSNIDSANTDIANKKIEIANKQSQVNATQSAIDLVLSGLSGIRDSVSLSGFFTDAELLTIDRYIKEDSISDSTFVTHSDETYVSKSNSSDVQLQTFSISDAVVDITSNTSSRTMYIVKGGEISCPSIMSAKIIQGIVEKSIVSGVTSIVATLYLETCTYLGDNYDNACLSLTGQSATVSATDSSISLNISSGYLYFTTEVSEYEKRLVSYELYNHGKDILNRISNPSYTFSVESANFLSAVEFDEFKNKLRLGQKIYLEVQEDKILEPIVIGVSYKYDSLAELSLTFGDKYSMTDSSFELSDLLEKSISMGKSVDLKRFTYSSFVDSGASTEVKAYMNSALDVSRNGILSSNEQAVSWDGSGIRLRKWANESHTAYLDNQVWLNNNSIMMSADNWATAEIAIGSFQDNNLGSCYGIVAPSIVGTLLAGEKLIIESTKKDGGTSVFKVDSDGCYLFNSYFNIVKDGTQISLNPDHGIVIGNYPVYKTVEGEEVIDETKAKLWADSSGNLNLTGRVNAQSGNILGRLYMGQQETGKTFFLDGSSDAIYKIFFLDTIEESAFLVSKYGEVSASKATIMESWIGDCSLENCTIAEDCTILGTLAGKNISLTTSTLGTGLNGRIGFKENDTGMGRIDTYFTMSLTQENASPSGYESVSLWDEGLSTGVKLTVGSAAFGELDTISSEITLWQYPGGGSIRMYAETEGMLVGNWTLNDSVVLSQGTFKTPTLMPYGFETHYLGDIMPNNGGYIKVATITITKSYADATINFSISQRRRDLSELALKFTSSNGLNPTIDFFKFTGGNINAKIRQVSTSVWDLYIEKTESYDVISITNMEASSYMRDHITLEWKKEHTSTIPSGTIFTATRDVGFLAGSSNANGGYIDVPGGLKIQWGIVSYSGIASGGDVTVTLPVSFTAYNTYTPTVTMSGGNNATVGLGARSPGSFIFRPYNTSGSAFWIAIGT